ncbi:MAG TPA: serine hydrolase domain-containing protein [Nakamurella sp.]
MDLKAEIADWPVGSASVAVVGPDGVIDVVDDGGTHDWMSVTKILTALTILDASVEGVVGLDDEVGPPGATLAHLLAHASGIAPDSDQVMGRVGTRRIYSNRGIELAADHLASAGGRPFVEQLDERVLGLLEMTGTTLHGSPAHGARGTIEDLATLGWELLRPRLLMPEVVRLASTVAFPGLSGVVPGFGKQQHNDWGLGCEIRDHKSPHWTAPENSPGTFGHFGQSGSFLWVDREADLACMSLCDTAFGPWAAQVWPRLSSRVLAEYA